MPSRLDTLCRDYLLVGPWAALAVVIALAAAGAVAGLAFPKWQANGLLETPGVVVPFPPRQSQDDVPPEPKSRYVTLAEYRKTAAAYSSESALHEYLSAAGKQGPAAERLLAQAELPGFWDAVVSPVLPFSRRDAREFGDLKDAASDSLVGLDVTTGARTPELAREMLGIVGGHFSNALVRERIRAWILKNRGEARARNAALRAEVVEGRMKIDATGRRIGDLKSILARYPEAAKLDSRQVVAISEGSDRFLSPLAQLVAAESFIAKEKETIERKEREARQFDLLERYFTAADEKLQSTLLASELIKGLSALAGSDFEGVDRNADWVREVVYRLQANIAAFSAALYSFDFRNEHRVGKVAFRDPGRLAALGAAAGLILLGIVAFVRASLRAARNGAAA